MARLCGWVLYDGGCGICSRGMPRLGRFFARLGLGVAPLQAPWVAQATGQDAATLERDIGLLLVPGNHLLRGADVYRWVLRRRWLTLPLWLLATLPVGRQLFALVYCLVAWNRRRLSRMCGIRPPAVLRSLHPTSRHGPLR